LELKLKLLLFALILVCTLGDCASELVVANILLGLRTQNQKQKE
jgi:hypothetical protein